MSIRSVRNMKKTKKVTKKLAKKPTHKPASVELGQMFFGHGFQPLDVPPYVEAALVLVRENLSRYQWNMHQKDAEIDPFGNSGAEYKDKVFEVQAYDWSEPSDQEYNFKWKDFKLSWYKYFGRGMSMSREMSPDEAAVMLSEILANINKKEEAYFKKRGL